MDTGWALVNSAWDRASPRDLPSSAAMTTPRGINCYEPIIQKLYAHCADLYRRHHSQCHNNLQNILRRFCMAADASWKHYIDGRTEHNAPSALFYRLPMFTISTNGGIIISDAEIMPFSDFPHWTNRLAIDFFHDGLLQWSSAVEAAELSLLSAYCFHRPPVFDVIPEIDNGIRRYHEKLIAFGPRRNAVNIEPPPFE